MLKSHCAFPKYLEYAHWQESSAVILGPCPCGSRCDHLESSPTSGGSTLRVADHSRTRLWSHREGETNPVFWVLGCVWLHECPLELVGSPDLYRGRFGLRH